MKNKNNNKSTKNPSILPELETFSFEIGDYFSTTDSIIIFKKLEGLDPKATKDRYEEDIYNLRIGLNIWCNLFEDITHNSGRILATRIKLYGLQETIKEADEFRLYLISDHTRGSYSEFWNKYMSNSTLDIGSMLTVLGQLRRIRISSLDYSFMYQDYLKQNRFCGNFLDTRCRVRWDLNRETNSEEFLSEDSRGNNQVFPAYSCTFLDEEKRPSSLISEQDWSLQHPNPSVTLLNDLATDILNIFRHWKQDFSLFTLPPGVTYEGAKTYYDKFMIVLRNQQWLRERGVNIPSIAVSGAQVPPADCNRYITVPKNYKTGRGVAPEPVSRQVLGYQISSGMRKCLREFDIDLRDQGRNQVGCCNAWHKKYATVDFSAASDSISFGLVKALWKYLPEMFSKMLDCRTNWIQVNGDIYPNYRFGTMGNAITFDIETSIFLAIAHVAYDYNKLFGNDDLTGYDRVDDIYVYGDDVIIPACIFNTFYEISTAVGFSINLEKTYVDSNYKESCGVEYYKGHDVTGKYYPRGTSRKALSELVGLQHKYVDYPCTNEFIIACILDVFPEMTTSYIGSDYSDIWSINPKIVKGGHLAIGSLDWIGYDWYAKVSKGLAMKGKKADGPYYRKLPRDFRYKRSKAPNGYTYVYSEMTRKSFHGDSSIPEDAYGELHTTVVSKSTGHIPEDKRDMVEYLMYLLTLGEGLDHINNSEYTSPTNQVRSRLDLLGTRSESTTNKRYHD
jgi:hypothetical protein